MAGVIKSHVQLGDSATATNNFMLTAQAADGTMKLARGNNGATTSDIITVSAAGLVAFPQGTGGSVLTSGTAQATTSGTSIDFTSIPSWVKRITVMLSAVSTNGTSNIQIQLGSGSLTTSGYSSQVAVVTSTTAVGSAGSTSGFIAGTLSASTDTSSSVCTIVNVTGNTWAFSMVGHRTPTGVATQFAGAAPLTLSGSLDRIRITTVNGTDTFDAGLINIMYE